MRDRTRLLDGEPGTSARLPVDWWVVNDGASAALPDLVHGKKLTCPEKVKVFIDHDTPCGSVEAALKQKTLIRFAEENGCELFNGRGISHQIMLDRFVRPGDVVAGCFDTGSMYGAVNATGVSLSPERLAQSMLDGETVIVIPETVHIELTGAFLPPASAKDVALSLRAGRERSLEGSRVIFTGAESLALPERITLCQMLDAAFAGFADGGCEKPDAVIDLAKISPVVAGPNDLNRTNAVSSLSGTAVNEVFIGGCSGGRIGDLRLAASILAGKRVPSRVRLMVAPATTEVYRQAADEGLLEIFLDAGAILMNQGCSVCWGKSQGIVEDGEVLLSSGSRCHKGCAGSESAEVYLCSPAVAAHSALAGSIRESL